MNANNKRNAAIGIPFGLVLCTAAVILSARHLIPTMGCGALFVAGGLIYVWGCAAWARSKGYSAAQGMFFGVAFPPSLLLMLRDRTKMSKAERDEEDREAAEEQSAKRAARRRPLKGGQKAFAWLLGLFLFAVGAAMITGYEVHWARVVSPERKVLATAIPVASDKLDPQNDGKLIHVTGVLAGAENLTDPEFGVTVNALRLRRRVWMYQWQDMGRKSKSSYGTEDSHGNVTPALTTEEHYYVKVWSEKILQGHYNGGRLSVPVPGTPLGVRVVGSGHDNPAAKAIPDQSAASAHVTLGVFTVTADIVNQIDNFQPVPLNNNNLSAVAAPLRANAKLLDNAIYFGTNADQPAIGDLKVQFESAPPAAASVIARQNGNSLSPYPTANGGSLALLRMGTWSVQEMGAQFARDKSQTRLLVWIAGCIFILLGSLFIKQAWKRAGS